ncbi:MAG TPA: hypothetical protein VM187_02275 [Niastella sp.]|nr:hypothetical protein [Niastella sp.]
MYTNVWNKYLPVIKILLKRSKSGTQQLSINQSDFEKAGLARKSGSKFSLQFINGRIDNIVIASPVAAELASNLLHDETVKGLFAEHDYKIDMNTKYLLSISQLERAENSEAAPMQLSHTH